MKLDDIPEEEWDELEADLRREIVPMIAKGMVIVMFIGMAAGMILMYIWTR